jgi:hypothetical protein
MEDLLIDGEQWVAVIPVTILTGMLKEEWEKLERRAKSMIRICLVDSILLNVTGDDFAKKPWDKLGRLY